jgi:copper chaperone CopZ
MKELELDIEGMHCGACVKRVQTALSGVTGVAVRAVSIGSAKVAFDDATTSLEALAEVVTRAGYRMRGGEEG